MSDYDAVSRMVIPPHMMKRLRAYIEQGAPTGDFLRAVLTNDLREAVARADDTNILILPAYVRYLYNEADGRCWGSPAKVQAWVARHEQARAGSAP